MLSRSNGMSSNVVEISLPVHHMAYITLSGNELSASDSYSAMHVSITVFLIALLMILLYMMSVFYEQLTYVHALSHTTLCEAL